MTRPERIPLHEIIGPHADPQRLRIIARRINAGALFVYPTETIYGLGGAWNVSGMRERVVAAKKRPPDRSLILIASDRKFFSCLPIVFPEKAELLAKTFWPGLLTLVLPVLDSPDGQGIRVSDHPFIEALYEFIDVPLFSTSANISGREYRNDPDAIYADFEGSVDFMIDAGKLPRSAPSTVVRVAGDGTVDLLREGAIEGAKIVHALDASMEPL